MKHNGVMLYSEVDKFENIAGNLVSFYHPPNRISLRSSYHTVHAAISALMENYVEKIRRNYPDGGPGSLTRKKLNWSISQIRRSRSRITQDLYGKLQKNVWKG